MGLVIRKRHDLNTVLPLRFPYQVSVDASGLCNFSCFMCPYSKPENVPEKQKIILPMERFKKIAADLEAFVPFGGVKVVNLAAGLGEPLMNKNIVEIVKLLRDKKVCRDIRMTSNGSLLTKELSDELIDAGLNLLRISVEAISDEGYAQVMGRPLPFFKYEKLVENVEYYFQKSRGTESKIAVRAYNDTMVGEADVVTFHNTWDKITDEAYIQHTDDIWPEYSFHAERKQLGATWYNLEENPGICTQPLTTMNIHADGEVTVCCADWNGSLTYGNVDEKTLLELWNSEELRTLQMAMLRGRNQIKFCVTV